MAEDDDSSRTEEPTQKKLEEAHKRGDVAKSQELPTFFVLFAATMILMIAAGPASTHLASSLRGVFEHATDIPADGAHLRVLMLQLALAIALSVGLPLFGLAVAGLISHLIQHRFVWSLDPITPKLSKISPLSGLKRMFSVESIVNLVKGIIKIVIIACAIYFALWPERDRFDAYIVSDPATLLPSTLSLILKMMTTVLAIMFLIAALDYLFQRTRWYNRQRMSVQELKEEYKHQEGNPEVKAKVKQLRRQRARRRMISNIPKAAVVITNPTHFAVALQYDKGMGAPVCVAKGLDALALKIREEAKKYDVPVVENPPLARALHATVDLGEEIPPDHYKAVAQIIGYVMTLKAKKNWAAQ